jgi:hypothetical protein
VSVEANKNRLGRIRLGRPAWLPGIS